MLNLDNRRDKIYAYAEIAVIILLAIIPLFISFPYRVNIFLSWEGAYRMSQGHIPYKDFGMPMGFMYWVVPALFMKIFGTQMITLIKAQVFINIISGLAFRSILKNIGVQSGIKLLSVVLFCISYSFFNFWPWYNHSVIVYQIVAFSFLTRYIFIRQHWVWLFLAALFSFFSFFTKQDAGAMTILICLALLATDSIYKKVWKPFLIFLAFIVSIGILFIVPFTQYNFGYWFNHGQPPHTSRFSAMDLVNEFLFTSQWIKFYLFLMLLLPAVHFKNWKTFLANRTLVFFYLFTLAILFEASVLQVTSYTPPDNNIFFHSFALAFILYFLSQTFALDFSAPKILLTGLFGLLLWWSGIFWKYMYKIADRIFPQKNEQLAAGGENIVNKRTYILNAIDTTVSPASEWVFTDIQSFKKIYMPQSTADGIKRFMNLPEIRSNNNLQVLNMTELTPLAAEVPFQLERGPEIPLWYHLGVSMFNKEAAMYETWIAEKKYDVILFEHIPVLNNFYPFRVRDSIQKHYRLIDSFEAPRHADTKGTIEVYMH